MIAEQKPTIPREDESISPERLEPFLRETLPHTEGELTILQFPGGRANLTYLIQFGDTDYVLRRPPLGPIAPSSHDMRREYRVLSKLSEHFPLAPKSFLYCEDETIIGAPFQVMERRHGLAIRQEVPTQFDNKIDRQRLGQMVVDVLADFHSVDRISTGLENLGHPEGFVERQLNGWADRWHKARHEENEEMSQLIHWLQAQRPKSTNVSLLHNDYKLDNLLTDPTDASRCVAILDWDMCTSGDPLMDLGYLLNQWADPDDPREWIEISSMPTHKRGFPTRAEVIDRYAKRTGFSVDNIGWHFAFAAMRFAVIIQQIFIRFHRGQTMDHRFADFGERARVGVHKGLAIADQQF